jgi:hypothetical protein
MTTRARARRTLAAALIVLLPVAALGSAGAARAQTRRTTTTTTTTTTEPTTVAVAPGETAPNGGPLLVPGDVSSSEGLADETSNDNTGTVVALVISGLLVVALLLALLTYWFWRNTRPTKLEASKSESDPTPEAATTPAAEE